MSSDFAAHTHPKALEEKDGSRNICTHCGDDLTASYRVSVMEYRDEFHVAFQFKENVFCDYECLLKYSQKFEQKQKSHITNFFRPEYWPFGKAKASD